MRIAKQNLATLETRRKARRDFDVNLIPASRGFEPWHAIPSFQAAEQKIQILRASSTRFFCSKISTFDLEANMTRLKVGKGAARRLL